MKKPREGYKMTELGEIPKEWEVRKLGEVCEINPELLNNNSNEKLLIKYIDIESVTTGKINNIKEFYFAEAPSRARRKIKYDDVIISTVRPYLKAISMIKLKYDNLICSTGFAVLRAKKAINPNYIFHSVLSDYYTLQLINKMVGSNYPAVNSKDIAESLIIVPPLPEQQKIADILSTVDEQIENIDKLIEKTKELKKGLMQRLLTKGIGHKEFKKTEIGMIPKEWEVKKLGEVCEILIGGTPSRNISEYWDIEKEGSNVWVSIKDLTSVNRYIEDSAEYITDLGVKNSNVKLIPQDTVIMSFKLTIGKTAITKRNLYTNEAIAAFIENENEVNNLFLFYILPLLNYDVDLAVKGATLNKEKLINTLIPLPTLSEQKEIASILSKIDDKLEEYLLQKEELEQLKKGLMQKLLTGKIRVKA